MVEKKDTTVEVALQASAIAGRDHRESGEQTLSALGERAAFRPAESHRCDDGWLGRAPATARRSGR